MKAVTQAVPAYAMSVFRIPIGLCNEIQRGMARFWWGSKEDRKGMHWTKCEKMSCAKYREGMGFRDISSFNQALVAKQGWRLIQYPNSLVVRVLKAKYFKNSHFLEAKTRSNPSFV